MSIYSRFVANALSNSEHSDAGWKTERLHKQVSKHDKVIADLLGWMVALVPESGI
jgi:hypothetical protein